MRKILIATLGLLLTVGIVNAKQLWEYGDYEDRAYTAYEIGLVGSPSDYQGDLQTNLELLAYYKADSPQDDVASFGGTSLIAGSTYNLSGSGISSSATSITLTKLTIPQNGYEIQDSDLSDTFYITVEPGSKTRQEIVSCTTVAQNANDTATLSGCTRGLSPITPFTASTTLRFSHGGGAQVIFSDPPQVFEQYAGRLNSETVSGMWTFSIPPLSVNPTTSLQVATKSYADNIANQGAATSSEVIAGIIEQATQIEMASSTPFGVNDPHAINSEYATSSPSAVTPSLYVVVTENDGKINQGFFDLTEDFAFTGDFTSTKLSVTDATTTSNLIVGTSSFSAPTNTLTVMGTSYFNDSTRFATTTTFLGSVNVNKLATSSALNWEVTGTTAETTVFTYTIDKDDIGLGGVIKITIGGYYSEVSGTSCDVDIFFGTQQMCSISPIDTGEFMINCDIINNTTNTGQQLNQVERLVGGTTWDSGDNTDQTTEDMTVDTVVTYTIDTTHDDDTCRIHNSYIEYVRN